MNKGPIKKNTRYVPAAFAGMAVVVLGGLWVVSRRVLFILACRRYSGDGKRDEGHYCLQYR